MSALSDFFELLISDELYPQATAELCVVSVIRAIRLSVYNELHKIDSKVRYKLQRNTDADMIL